MAEGNDWEIAEQTLFSGGKDRVPGIQDEFNSITILLWLEQECQYGYHKAEYALHQMENTDEAIS